MECYYFDNLHNICQSFSLTLTHKKHEKVEIPSKLIEPKLIRGLFGKFVEFGYKTFIYLYNPFIFLNITGGHY